MTAPMTPCALDESVFLVDGDRRQRGGARERVAVIGEAAGTRVAEMSAIVRRMPDRAERHVGARQSLGHRHQIGHDVPVVDGEPLAGATEAGHHFVGDQQNAVLRRRARERPADSRPAGSARRWCP